MVAPVIPILQTQYAAYANRGIGLIPSQAGAGSSTIGGTISIYAVGANLIWAFFGYHADGAMVQIAALWPLLMLLAFVMLGRGRSGPSLLLLALVVVPMAALFAIGSPPQRPVRAALLLRFGAGDAAAGGARSSRRRRCASWRSSSRQACSRR